MDTQTSNEQAATLDYRTLRDAVTGGSAGVRIRTELEPLGGVGAKVFPPTYKRNVDSKESMYALEERVVNGKRVPCVLVDSVASQANRMEAALQDALEAGEVEIPDMVVDFGGEDLGGVTQVSVFNAPHRVFDAVFRDSTLDGVLFRKHPIGESFERSTPKDAGALFHYSPTTLLFGAWDSTGALGGLGTKFERLIESEVVAFGVADGVTVGGRLDPLLINTSAVVYEADNEMGWTTDESEATRDKKGNPKKFPKAKGESTSSDGSPSLINHSNIPPTVKDLGGVTAESIAAMTTISFRGIRRMRFPRFHDGSPVAPEQRREVEGAAQTALAALGIAAISLAARDGFNLRSRCSLAPVDDPMVELIGRTTRDVRRFVLDADEAVALLAEAVDACDKVGIGWRREPLTLQPTAKLVGLIRESRCLAAEEAGDTTVDQ